MEDRQLVKISKYLALHLRHRPERLGLTLEPGGWVAVDALLAACQRDRFPITRERLQEVVEKNGKRRFSFDETGTRIRANQGHSVAVDLQLDPATPPAVLYHGTYPDAVEAILQGGLRRMSRHHVHLSKDIATARAVGMRRGKPVVLAVDAAAMAAQGHVFYCSANGVWLVDEVPPAFLRRLGE
jgi:putative RNA 2'-phosphotransferase